VDVADPEPDEESVEPGEPLLSPDDVEPDVDEGGVEDEDEDEDEPPPAPAPPRSFFAHPDPL
jgi:hypothetical protein